MFNRKTDAAKGPYEYKVTCKLKPLFSAARTFSKNVNWGDPITRENTYSELEAYVKKFFKRKHPLTSCTILKIEKIV